jgi:UDP-N-acetylglucosamine 2-epimerase (non-hydrolysing)
MKDTYFVLTDSGGIQEESTYLHIPCFTFRKSTERPITISQGSNTLIEELNADKSMVLIDQFLAGKTKKSTIPPLWDGKAATRIVAQLENIFTIVSS